VQWKNIKECVLDKISDLIRKVEKRAGKPWITQDMKIKMDEKGSGRLSTLKKAGRTTGG
jgi:hypothetical protein